MSEQFYLTVRAKLIRSHVTRGALGDVLVLLRWRTEGGVEWDGKRSFPTLGRAIDHLSWLYASQRAEFGG